MESALIEAFKRYFVVMPSFGDNKSAAEICSELNELTVPPFMIIILDDSIGFDTYSNLPPNTLLVSPARRLGQQRILVQFFRNGFSACANPELDDLVVVMDADGEDSPSDVEKLVLVLHADQVDIAHAQRTTRQSAVRFKIGYFLFRVITRIISGQSFKTGVFSATRWMWLRESVQYGPFNSSFSGGLVSAPGNHRFLSIPRANRRYGSSRLNTSGLLTYAFNIFSTMSHNISVRIFLFSTLLFVSAIAGSLLVVSLWILGVTVPGYTSIVLISIAQISLLSFVLFFTAFQSTKLSEIREPEVEFTIQIKGR